MTNPVKKAVLKKGLHPGTLIHVGERKVEHVRMTVIDYDPEMFIEREYKLVEECLEYADRDTVTWINVNGLHDTGIINRLGEHFGIHSLVLEDILDTDKRPELDDYVDYIFIILKMIIVEKENDRIDAEQISLLLCKNTVISFQEGEGDVFEHIRERIRTGKGRVRASGADYLIYLLTDAVVDNYFIALEEIGEFIGAIEDELLDHPSAETLKEIYELKRDLVLLRKYAFPLRELVHKFQISESPLIQPNTKLYIRDLYDHAMQIMDTTESYRDMLAGMLETYLSLASNRMNEVMKVLTVMATIFIPLTFIAGVYGMNFEHMPELHQHLGYPGVLTLMLMIALGMVYYFRRKKWI
ncbi:MAG TPA: magnesium/cobalt transporter CorA [Thermodesulfobacteriota bacterium]|nr:magnesium/cobalt transporter CorA [Thermodesulfobacteriota bacterium]